MTKLLLPADVTDVLLGVLRRRHSEHLALTEREREVPPGTFPPLQTIDHLAGEGFRLKTDTPPSVLVGNFGSANPPERDRSGAYKVEWTVAVEVTAVGAGRADTLLARDVYALTVVECLLDRVPRAGEPIDALRLEDMDLIPSVDEESQQTVAQARLLFVVTTRQALGRGLLPLDNTPIEPGQPGGPPVDTYTPPEPYPPVQHATTTTIKDPLT